MRTQHRIDGITATRSGFTLIEMLVVISIITLLIAILLPALRLARNSARSVQCLSNLRQMGIAIHSYTIAYDDVLPLVFERSSGDPLIDSPETSGIGWSWAGLLHKESQTPVNLFQCLADETPAREVQDLWGQATSVSYAATFFFWGNTSVARPPWSVPAMEPPRFSDEPRHLRLADIQKPSRVQNVWDGARVAYSASTLAGAKTNWPVHIATGSVHREMWRHYPGTLTRYTDYGPNALFVDGHATSNIDLEALEEADVAVRLR